MGEFSALTQKNHSEQVHKVCFSETNWLEHFILTFWKKLIFHVSDSTLYIKKTKIFQKWEKMNFDGLFELAIDILVGIEYLNVKIG